MIHSTVFGSKRPKDKIQKQIVYSKEQPGGQIFQLMTEEASHRYLGVSEHCEVADG